MRTKRLGDILLDNGWVSAQDIQEALDMQAAYPERPLLGKILLQRKWITKSQLDIAVLQLKRQQGINVYIIRLLLTTLIFYGMCIAGTSVINNNVGRLEIMAFILSTVIASTFILLSYSKEE